MMKSWWKLLLALLGITAVLTPTLPTHEAGVQTAAAQTAVDPRFGAVESFWAPNEAAELGIGWDRILFYWNEIQPNGPGDWNTLHVLEEWLVDANNNGRTILGLLKNTPNWATDGEFASGVPRGLYLPIDDPGNLWANYVRQVTRYYGPRGVHNWIVWNEPDIAAGVYGYEFGGSTQDYYQLVKVAYQVIKQVDPTATVHLGGMTYWHDPSFLRQYLNVVVADPEAAANDYFFDVISLHIYFRPETMSTIIGNAFAVQSALGISPLKAVWVNETNARPSQDPEWPVQVQAFELDLEQQAWYIPQAFALGFYAGAARMGIYKLVDVNMSPGDESWGLIRPYDFSRRPAYYSYQTTIKYLSGFTYPVRREAGGNYFIVSFTRPQGLTRVMWARYGSPVSLRVPALAESAQLVDALGNVTVVTAVNGAYEITLEPARCAGECLIGGPPLFLVEEGVAPEQVPTAPPPPPPTNAPVLTTTVTITPTVAATATLTPTATATATFTPTPTKTPTATTAPTETFTPTPSPTMTATQLPTMEPTMPVDTAVTDQPSPSSQASWWFIGGGVLLAIFIAVVPKLRRPPNDA